jgi:small-conductance mechanosensitive channel
LPISEVGDRSEVLAERLAAIEDQRPTQSLSEIETQLEELRNTTAEATERVRTVLEGAVAPLEIEAQVSIWNDLSRRFEGLQSQVSDVTGLLEDQLTEVTKHAELWTETRKRARASRAPDAVLQEIERVRADLARAEKRLGEDLSLALELRERVQGERRGLEPTLERIESAKKELTAGLLLRQDAPIWSAVPGSDAIVALPETLASHLSALWAELVRYASARRDLLLVQGLFFLFLVWFLSRARAERERRLPEGTDRPGIALRHPWAAALLVVNLLTPFLHPQRVPGFTLVLTPLTLVAWLRVLTPMLPPAMSSALIGLTGLGLLELARFALTGVPILHRSLLVFDLGACLAGIFWLRRPERLMHLPWREARNPWLRLLGIWMRLDVPALGGGLVAALLGYTVLADRIALFAIVGTILGGGWATVVLIGEAVIEHLVDAGALARLRMLRTSRAAFMRVTRRALRGVGVLAWLMATLQIAGFRSPAQSALVALLSASLGYGAVSVSLGGVLAFVLTLWISWLLSRFTSFALEQEVFSRVRMPPGVPFALSRFGRYAILVIGFVLAMGAIGFPLDRVTLVLSALGVGIGFGLQNVVNNFVSGAILLFERPIRVGDRVQIDDLLGTVSTIGIRASTVRTFDGADVTVPNGDFISSRVTNWTFADRQRRIILPVGVAYGTQPRRVIELLEEVARANPEVVADPPPEVLFRGFGDSSLDFEIRAFTEADWLAVSSDLAVATSDAFEAAGIEIPFPQRDLHLRNIPELRQALEEVVRARATASDAESR